MTLILGYVHAGVAHLAADRGAYDPHDHSQVQLALPKIVHVNPRIIAGASGSMRLIQLLQYTAFPPCEDGRDPLEWIVRVLIPLLQRQAKDDNVDSTLVHSSILLASRNRLFMLEEDWGVVESVLPYAAVGSGAMAALGAVEATHARVSAGMSVRNMLHEAFRCARVHVHTMGVMADVETTQQ